MSGEVAAKVEPIATLHAVDRKGRTIDLAPAWPLLHRVLRDWSPERIQLFGSRARGEAHPDSDWDILVVVPEASSATADPLVPWRLRRDSGVRADVVVYEPVNTPLDLTSGLLMVTESFAGHIAFGVTDVAFAMGRRRLRRSVPARVTIKIPPRAFALNATLA